MAAKSRVGVTEIYENAVEIRDRISGVMDSWSEELGDLAPAEAVMEQEDDG